MAFVELTRKGGQVQMVNVDNVASIRDRAGDNLVVVMMVGGQDFEVMETYEELTPKFMAGMPNVMVVDDDKDDGK